MTLAVFPGDPKRVGRVIEIEEYMRRLKDVWLANPELRLGQLIENTFCKVSERGEHEDPVHDMNLYALTDESMVRIMEEKNDGTDVS